MLDWKKGSLAKRERQRMTKINTKTKKSQRQRQKHRERQGLWWWDNNARLQEGDLGKRRAGSSIREPFTFTPTLLVYYVNQYNDVLHQSTRFYSEFWYITKVSPCVCIFFLIYVFIRKRSNLIIKFKCIIYSKQLYCTTTFLWPVRFQGIPPPTISQTH